MATSQIRQNFSAECEASINKHINIELHASYVYQSMVLYFLCFLLFDINVLLFAQSVAG